MKPLLDIIIVNWNSGRQLRDCLESIAGTDRTGFQLQRVVVVDNGSTDGSIDGLDTIGSCSTVIRNQRDLGYGAAANQGARGSGVDYLLFLNPDTRLYPDSLVKPLRFMEQRENARIAICGVQLLDRHGQVARHCTRFPRPSHFFSKMVGFDKIFPRHVDDLFMSEWDHKESREVDHVMGAFWLMRQSVFDELGGFDENFFLYLEDVDFSFRAKQAGWRSYYFAEAHIHHNAGSTTEGYKAESLFYRLQSRILYGYKHFNLWSATGLMLGTLLLEPLSRLAFGIVHRSKHEIAYTLKGYLMLWRSLIPIIRVASYVGRNGNERTAS
ncbi:MAG: glycosyltransferase family 2 protein [Ignavibacteriae bacterium]|nr:glycosyltransferase family 2 protein [Ignavibacteriota bacterium]